MRTIRLTREWLAAPMVLLLLIYPVLAILIYNLTQSLPLGLCVLLAIALALGYPGIVFLLAFVVIPKDPD
jgi:hypothetical protein